MDDYCDTEPGKLAVLRLLRPLEPVRRPLHEKSEKPSTLQWERLASEYLRAYSE
jgi:hypothetical protein